jgi:tRNA pseudouridine38-40 synthase
MRNVKLTLAYDGTVFHGWQVQPEQPTVQGLLTDVLREITQEAVTVYGAGRTDAGVHAWGQVANFSTSSHLDPGEFIRALNALLPSSIRVRAAAEVAPNFHARWNAVAKTYVYRIYRGRVVPPFHWRYVLHEYGPLDLAAMAEAAGAFIGEQDFTSFAASSGSEAVDQDRLIRRSVYQSELLSCGESSGTPSPELMLGDLPWPAPGPDEWVYAIRGKSFLRHMVRKIVGALLEVGRGRLQPPDIPRLIEARDRTQCGTTAPPQGLCLASVEYPDPTKSLNGETVRG